MRVGRDPRFGATLALGRSQTPVAAQAAAQQETDRKVEGGGITVPGWTGKEDAGNKQGLHRDYTGSSRRRATASGSLYWPCCVVPEPRQRGQGATTR